ncbi:MAG: hypothetical protein AAF480_12560 [Actinomycetota bacterium]
MRRRRYAMLVFAILAAVLATAPAQAAESEDVEDVRLRRYLTVRTNRTAAVTKGDTAWVTVSLRGRQDIEDLRVTASIDQEGAAVGYPANTETYTSTYADADLDRRETDYIAFQVTIPTEVDGRGRTVQLEMEFTFTHEGDRLRAEDTVRIPVVDFDGSPFALSENEIELPPAANGWVELPFAGLAPEVTDFRIVVEDPPGLDIHYPAETHTSLARDAVLEDGESDVARFRLGEAHWAEPTDATIRVDYVLAGDPASETFDITITPG